MSRSKGLFEAANFLFSSFLFFFLIFKKSALLQTEILVLAAKPRRCNSPSHPDDDNNKRKKKNWRRLKLSIWSIKWWKCFPEFSIQSWRMLSGKVLATRQYYAFENLQILMKYGAHEYTLLWSECALSLFNIRTRFSWLLFLMHLDNTKFPSSLKLILLARRHVGIPLPHRLPPFSGIRDK